MEPDGETRISRGLLLLVDVAGAPDGAGQLYLVGDLLVDFT